MCSGGLHIVRHSGECWASVHLGRQVSWQLQSSGWPLSGGAGIPALRLERLDSSAGRQGGKYWVFMLFGVIDLLMLPTDEQVIVFLHSVGIWHYCSLPWEWGLSHCQAQWGVLDLWALRGCRTFGAVHWIASCIFASLSGESGFLALWERNGISSIVRHHGKHWAFLPLRKWVSWYPQSGTLTLSGGTGFLFIDRAVGTLPWKGLVVSTGPLCFEIILEIESCFLPLQARTLILLL
jgi:hypothetical protein